MKNLQEYLTESMSSPKILKLQKNLFDFLQKNKSKFEIKEQEIMNWFCEEENYEEFQKKYKIKDEELDWLFDNPDDCLEYWIIDFIMKNNK